MSFMAQIKPGDRVAYTTPHARYEGVALLVAAERVVAALSVISTDRVGGEEVRTVGPESTTPSVLPVADVEVV